MSTNETTEKPLEPGTYKIFIGLKGTVTINEGDKTYISGLMEYILNNYEKAEIYNWDIECLKD